MWEGSYGREPFDLRLTVLYMMGRWKLIALCTLLGTLLFGGLYCVKNILLRGETQYRAESVYRADYAVADGDLDKAFINAYTWNTYVHTEEFLATVKERLEGSGAEQMSMEELGGCITGNLESDWRVPSTVAVTEDPQKSVAIARAVEETMTTDFPAGIKEIDSIRVIDGADRAAEVIPDVRPGRAFVLSAVLSCFFTVAVLLLKEIGADSIRLPATIRYRYGLKVAGTTESVGLKENISYLFAEAERAAVCAVQEDIDSTEVAERLKQRCEGVKTDFYPLPSPVLCPEGARVLREAQGILLVVKAGEHTGKQLEYALDYLTQQDCNITAVLLWAADERLIRYYYGFRKKERMLFNGERMADL